MNTIEAVYFSEELYQMSASLQNMAVHIEEKSQEQGEKQHMELPGEEEKLVKSVTRAHNEWIRFLSAVEIALQVGGLQKTEVACIFFEFANDVMHSVPMNNNHHWKIYATNSALPVRLAFILSSPLTSMTLAEMTSKTSDLYDSFTAAVFQYLQDYEQRRRYLEG